MQENNFIPSQESKQPEYGAYSDKPIQTNYNNASMNSSAPLYNEQPASSYVSAQNSHNTTYIGQQGTTTLPKVSAIFEKKSRVTIGRSYGEMTVGLIITAIVAYLFQSTGLILNLLLATNGMIMWGLIIAQLALVVWLSVRIMKMSEMTARLVFYGYAALTGITFSTIFFVYSLGSIVQVFFLCAGFFGALTMLSLTTKLNMLKAGPILMVGLIALIIGQFLAVFFNPGNTSMMIFSALGVILFAGLTMYDAQRTRAILEQYANQPEALNKLSIYCALSLYLDFINMFTFLLRILGNRQ